MAGPQSHAQVVPVGTQVAATKQAGATVGERGRMRLAAAALRSSPTAVAAPSTARTSEREPWLQTRDSPSQPGPWPGCHTVTRARHLGDQPSTPTATGRHSDSAGSAAATSPHQCDQRAAKHGPAWLTARRRAVTGVRGTSYRALREAVEEASRPAQDAVNAEDVGRDACKRDGATCQLFTPLRR